MSRVERLARAFSEHVAIGWPGSSSGAQRVIMVVYDPVEERTLRRKLELFAHGAAAAEKSWRQLDLTPLVAGWLAGHRYRETYFEEPQELLESGKEGIARALAEEIAAALNEPEHDRDAILAVYGIAGLYGFTSVSDVISRVEHAIRGRLVVFFPGRVQQGRYRLLDARESWDYHAVPITVDDSGEV